MIYRKIRISHGNFLDTYLNDLKEIFWNSGFPLKFIEKQIMTFSNYREKQNLDIVGHNLEIFPSVLIILMKIRKGLSKRFLV